MEPSVSTGSKRGANAQLDRDVRPCAETLLPIDELDVPQRVAFGFLAREHGLAYGVDGHLRTGASEIAYHARDGTPFFFDQEQPRSAGYARAHGPTHKGLRSEPQQAPPWARQLPALHVGAEMPCYRVAITELGQDIHKLKQRLPQRLVLERSRQYGAARASGAKESGPGTNGSRVKGSAEFVDGGLELRRFLGFQFSRCSA